jgi:hypothetical protein
MPNKLCYITPPLAAVAAAMIATAPAAANPTGSICMSLGGSTTQCQAPGNVQINDSPPPVHYKPQWNDRYGGDPIPPYPTS